MSGYHIIVSTNQPYLSNTIRQRTYINHGVCYGVDNQLIKHHHIICIVFIDVEPFYHS